MTIAATLTRQAYAGNGVTTEFSWPGVVYDEDDLIVVLVVDSTGVATVKTITTHYTVDVEEDFSGASVTMLTAPASGETLVLKRNTAKTQAKDLSARSRVDLDEIEEALDRLTITVQDLQEQLARCPKFAIESETTDITFPEPEAGKAIQWNSAGDDLENVTP